MGYVDKATSALIGSDLLGTVSSRDGSKIADITHADTDEHTITPTALGLPENVVAIYCDFYRDSGSGSFAILTTTGGQQYSVSSGTDSMWWKDDTGVFRYKLSAANDDWDIFCFGYFTKGRVLG